MARRKVVAESIQSGTYSENRRYRVKNGEVRYDDEVYSNGALIDKNTDGLTIVEDGRIVFDGLEKDKPGS